MGQLSISIEIRPCHSFTATTLWIIDQSKAASFYTLCLCQIGFQLGEVEGGIFFCHLLGINFLRGSWVSIHFQPSLAEYAKKGVTLGHHQHAGSKNIWSGFPKKCVDWVWALPYDNLSTYLWHPPWESCGWSLIPCIGFHLSKSKVLPPKQGLREGTHEFLTKLHHNK